MPAKLSDITVRLIEGLNRLAKWLLLIAIICLCWNIARIGWSVVAPPQIPELPSAKLQEKAPITESTNAALSIFDTNKPKDTTLEKPVPQITLAGVMVAIPSRLSSAMLEVNDVMTNYRIGEPLQDSGYKLIDITWEQVIIADDSDHQVVLKMPEPMSLDQNLNAATTDDRSPLNQQQVVPSARQSSSYPTPLNSIEETHNNDMVDDSASQDSPQAALASAVNELKQDPASYLSRMGVMVTAEGYQVTNAMPSQLRDRLGLEAGDRVISVNGSSVGSNPSADSNLLNQIKQSGEAQIEVKRGEQIFTIRQTF